MVRLEQTAGGLTECRKLDFILVVTTGFFVFENKEFVKCTLFTLGTFSFNARSLQNLC